MRDRIAKLLILLAAILLLGDLVWIFPHLASLVLNAVRRSPEGALLAGALILMVAAWLIRSGRRMRGGEESGAADLYGRIPPEL